MEHVKKFIRSALPILMCLAGAFVFLMLPKWLSRSPEISEWYALRLFPYLSWPIVTLTSLVPISITEIFVIASIPTVSILIVWYIVRAVRSREKKRFFYRSAVVLSVILLITSTSFTMMHGIGYSRRPLHESLELVPSERSSEELAEVMRWLATGVAENRPVLPENDQGGMVPIKGIEDVLRTGSEAMDMAAVVFPALSGNDIRVKPVALSHYWSYTGIVGMYFPFFGEANANIDVPAHTIPMTACHEISHVRGIAREQDANLAGFLACVSSDRPDFRYSGYMFALGYISQDLAAVDPEAYTQIARSIPDGAYRDMNISYEYWQQFEGPVEEISTEVNDTYLKANLQPEGVRSYSLVSQLIIEYYFDYVKGVNG
ncbi:MAG: DUF3810 domain-containing protein [Clostridiales bacterium]|nr:DUF3810 domain-containing protein [Clostridiales bacterium]